MVPTPNMKNPVSWDAAATKSFRDKVLRRIMGRTSMKDLDKHITCEKIITPAQWQGERSLFLYAACALLWRPAGP